MAKAPYIATIVVNQGKNLYDALLPELENSNWERSRFTIKKDKKRVIIEIIAQDATALRATFNNISKLVSVYEKVMEQK